MWDKIVNLFLYHGEIPQTILLRASTLASITGCYVAFDKNGECHLFPVKPMLLKNTGKWISRGRLGMFQEEEIKFTKFKYRYSNWDTLIEPMIDGVFPFTYEKYQPSKKIPKNSIV